MPIDFLKDMLMADGFEEAFIGISYPWQNGHKPVAVYDLDKCIDILMKRDSMTENEAREFFDFNIAGSYVGDQTPIFMERKTIDEFIF